MKDKIFSVLQRVGRSFMLPIAILPVAGLLLGIGSSLPMQPRFETVRSDKLARQRHNSSCTAGDHEQSRKCGV